MNQLPQTIKKFRESQGWSKAELGRKLGGVSGQLIGQYERDKDPKIPGGDFFVKWKNAFGFDLLGTETNVSQETKSNNEPELKAAIKHLAESVDRHSITDERNSRNIERLIALLENKYSKYDPNLPIPGQEGTSQMRTKKNQHSAG